MDMSLQQDSIRLDNTIKSLIRDSEQEYNQIDNRIKELNLQLQEKDMQTDHSENASYQAAKDERDIKATIGNMLLERISSLKTEVGNYAPTGYISLGTTVDLRVLSVNGASPHFKPTQFIVKLVQHSTSKAVDNLIAIDGKVGAAILGRKAGDVVEVIAPTGKITYRIERIY